jgi:hypothetical protein
MSTADHQTAKVHCIGVASNTIMQQTELNRMYKRPMEAIATKNSSSTRSGKERWVYLNLSTPGIGAPVNKFDEMTQSLDGNSSTTRVTHLSL